MDKKTLDLVRMLEGAVLRLSMRVRRLEEEVQTLSGKTLVGQPHYGGGSRQNYERDSIDSSEPSGSS